MQKTHLMPVAWLLFISASSAWCQTLNLQPKAGLWQIQTELPTEQKAAMAKMQNKMTVQSRQNGMSFDAQTGIMTLTQCLDAEKIQHWHQLSQDPRQHCAEPKIVQQGLRFTVDVTCTQPKPATVHSEIDLSANREQYQFTHLIKSEGKQMQLKGVAKRIGDCQ
ncbi:DUF3617 domain-containing protein [Chitinibacter sp. SCUT-21]|uniref:DUF3617 domain-containing protein n=1 Tax=Chitinibacter sp. SCUT-21 TaxID=2970891 RepID=UPI0035A62B33